MSANPPTIWMNVTTSAKWKRPPVGIVRVERSLCAELTKLYGSRLRQCVWHDNRFVEWSQDPELPPTMGQGKGETLPAVERSPILELMYPILPRKKALAALAQGLLSLLPRKLQPHFNRLLHMVRPRLGKLLKNERALRLIAKLRQSATVLLSPKHNDSGVLSSRPDIETLFASGDVLISVGLDWDHPYYKHFFALRKHRNVRVVTCCYDLIPVLYPQYCVNDVAGIFTSYFLEIADGSDLVLCISKQSEKDLNNLLDRTGGAQPPTHVFPLGDTVPNSEESKTSSVVKEVCQAPFILFVSTIERRKNHEVLYRAYHLLCQQGERANLPKLVFVGMQGWGVDELLKDIELDPLIQGLIIRLNHVSDGDLYKLYESAKFCVFPSLYEGWGLPVGEALSLGKAVICSGRGSLPEVGGNSVRYIDPWNPNAWADEILRMSTDDTYRFQWESKVKACYHQRTWTDAAISVKQRIDTLLDMHTHPSEPSGSLTEVAQSNRPAGVKHSDQKMPI